MYIAAAAITVLSTAVAPNYQRVVSGERADALIGHRWQSRFVRVRNTCY